MNWLRNSLLRLPWCRDLRESQLALVGTAPPWHIEPKLEREEIVNSRYAVVVFTARWDRSWKHYLPIVSECAQKLGSQAKVGFFDADNDEIYVRELKLANVPTIGFFRRGQVIALHLGYNLNLSAMAEFLLAGEANIPARIAKQERRL